MNATPRPPAAVEVGGRMPAEPTVPDPNPADVTVLPATPPATTLYARGRALLKRNERFEPLLGVFGFVAGFLWDTLTLTRIDKLSDNLILLGYLLILGGTVATHHRVRNAPERFPRLGPQLGWIDFAARFLFGGLFSAYVVYYFKSAGSWTGLLFVAVLTAVMVANEFYPGRLEHLRLRVALFAFCAFSFLLFFIPVVTGQLGYGVFLVAMVLAFGAGVFLGVYAEHGTASPVLLARRHGVTVGGLLAVLFVLDLAQIIPPIPLSLTDRGVYHSVERTDAGYLLTWQKVPWRPWKRQDETFHLQSGDRVYCFSAVFAPTGTGLAIVHVWQHWTDDGWQTSDTIPFQAVGGREGGFRGYTAKKNLAPGDWRVRVETETGRELGRCKFDAVDDAGPGDVWRTRVVN